MTSLEEQHPLMHCWLICCPSCKQQSGFGVNALSVVGVCLLPVMSHLTLAVVQSQDYKTLCADNGETPLREP